MSITKFRPAFTFTQDRLEQLKAIVPEAFADGKINWDSLKQALGEFLEDESPDGEHFGLFWPGKRKARRLAHVPSKSALFPAAGEGVNENSTRNLFIEGENLDVLKLLQKSYAGRIKMIYIDPPYNTGNDLVFRDDFKETRDEFLRKTEQLDENGDRLTTNTKAGGRFHSNWLNMLYPRLRLARNLIREDGIICISIDDSELGNLRLMCDEVFGDENFVECLVWMNKEGGGGSDSRFFRKKHEYLCVYSKNHSLVQISGVEISNQDRYTLSDEYESMRGKYYLQKLAQSSIQYSESLDYAIMAPDGTKVYPGETMGKKNCNRWSQRKVEWGIENGFIEFRKDRDGQWQVYSKQYLNCDNEGKVIERTNRPPSVIERYSTTQASKFLKNLFETEVFKYSKPRELLKDVLSLCSSSNDLILDFFAGSCTTAHAVLDLNREDGGNRQFIMVQIPEPTPENSPARKAGYDTIAEIGKERIQRVIAKMQKEPSNSERATSEDLGFKVFKLTDSNFKHWQPYNGEQINELENLFDDAETPLVKEWTPENLLTEIILQQGFPLDSKITQQTEFAANKMLLVESAFCAHRLFVCLDRVIAEETIQNLHLNTEDIFVCLDSALTDQAKMRLGDTCKLTII